MTRIEYKRDADGGLWCEFPDGSTCQNALNEPCTVSYCEDGEREQTEATA